MVDNKLPPKIIWAEDDKYYTEQQSISTREDSNTRVKSSKYLMTHVHNTHLLWVSEDWWYFKACLFLHTFCLQSPHFPSWVLMNTPVSPWHLYSGFSLPWSKTLSGVTEWSNHLRSLNFSCFLIKSNSSLISMPGSWIVLTTKWDKLGI